VLQLLLLMPLLAMLLRILWLVLLHAQLVKLLRPPTLLAMLYMLQTMLLKLPKLQVSPENASGNISIFQNAFGI
jgi:hypothetical protein